MKRWYTYCQNEECSEYNVLNEIKSGSFKWDGESSEMRPVVKNNRCPVCGCKKVLYGVTDGFVMGQVYVDSFSGLSAAQKHEILLKRYQKGINKDEIHENRKRMISKGIGYDKQ